MHNISENNNNDMHVRIEHDKTHISETLYRLGEQLEQSDRLRIFRSESTLSKSFTKPQ